MTKPELKKTNWQTTDMRFVAFLDILGFKEKVLRKTHSEIYKELSTFSSIKKSLEMWPEDKVVASMYIDVDIYIVSFSDSIVVFSKNDSVDNFKFFTTALKSLLAKSVKNKIALKGGIAHGEISLNKAEQIYFGQPIIDAYLLEEDVNFVGVLCHYSVDEYMRSNKLFPNNSYRFIEAPLKSGQIKHNVLDFFYNLLNSEEQSSDDKSKLRSIIKCFEDFYPTVSGSPRRYIDNSIKVIEKLNSEKLIFLSPIL